MENELQILNSIEKNENATQRMIARNTGLSLGNVNILIKRLVKKGLLKIERLNSRTIRYILTPQGLKKKAEATYKYVVASYRYINEINSRIDALLGSEIFINAKKVILLGNQDEIFELLKSKLNHAGISYEFIKLFDELINKLTTNNHQLTTTNHQLIIIWHPDFADLLKSESIDYVNLLDII